MKGLFQGAGTQVADMNMRIGEDITVIVQVPKSIEGVAVDQKNEDTQQAGRPSG